MIERSLSALGPSGFHRLVYSEWPGPKGAPTLICVHGLTRNAKDFDVIAEALSAHYRVICPDMPGRGRSDYLRQSSEYSFALYLADVAALIARLDVENADWLGTSMGGLIGMMLAARQGQPIRKLILNDASPFLTAAMLEGLAAYVGSDPTFPSIEGMEIALRPYHASFGPLSPTQLLRMTQNNARRRPDGTYGFDYDPHIGDALKTGPLQDVNLWPVYDAVCCPTLVLHGAVSTLLTSEVAEEMTRRGPKASVIDFPGVGHAPALLSQDQIGAVRDFLLS